MRACNGCRERDKHTASGASRHETRSHRCRGGTAFGAWHDCSRSPPARTRDFHARGRADRTSVHVFGRCHGHGLVSLKALPIGRQRCAHAFQSSGRLATPSVATALRRRQQAALWARRQWPALRPSLRLRNRWILAHGVWYASEPLVTAVRPPLCLSQPAFGPDHALCMTCHAQLLPRLALMRDPARLLIPLESLHAPMQAIRRPCVS